MPLHAEDMSTIMASNGQPADTISHSTKYLSFENVETSRSLGGPGNVKLFDPATEPKRTGLDAPATIPCVCTSPPSEFRADGT